MKFKKRKLKPLAVRKTTVTYWKKQADKLFSDIERSRVGHCQICNREAGFRKADGLQVVGLDLHHIIQRDWIRFRFVHDNSIVVCKSCHGSHPNFRNRACSAHGSLTSSKVFYERVRELYPEKMEFFDLHSEELKTEKDENGHIVIYKHGYYQEIFEKMKALA